MRSGDEAGQKAKAGELQSGFTLIELLVVIVILGILAGIAIIAVQQFGNDADNTGCATDKRRVETAITAYKAANDANPPSLVALTTGTPSFLNNDNISGNTLTASHYTLTYTPATGTVNDCVAAIAAGGGPAASSGPTSAPTATPTTIPTVSPSASPSSSSSPSPSPSPTRVPPTVTGCSPSSVQKNRLQTITVSGTGFNSTDAAVAVAPASGPVTVTLRSTTSVTFTIDLTNATEAKQVTVSSATYGNSATKAACFTTTN
jgi:general secretion pathway protein G